MFLPGGSYCRLVGEGAATGMALRPRALRPRAGCSEKARGSSQDQTVQNVLCPAPPWPRPKYPAWLLPCLLLGVTMPALEAQPGSAVWGSHREGRQDPVHLAWARPLTCSRPSSKPSWGTSVHLSYSGGVRACPPGKCWAGRCKSSCGRCCLETWPQGTQLLSAPHSPPQCSHPTRSWLAVPGVPLRRTIAFLGLAELSLSSSEAGRRGDPGPCPLSSPLAGRKACPFTEA